MENNNEKLKYIKPERAMINFSYIIENIKTGVIRQHNVNHDLMKSPNILSIFYTFRNFLIALGIPSDMIENLISFDFNEERDEILENNLDDNNEDLEEIIKNIYEVEDKEFELKEKNKKIKKNENNIDIDVNNDTKLNNFIKQLMDNKKLGKEVFKLFLESLSK